MSSTSRLVRRLPVDPLVELEPEPHQLAHRAGVTVRTVHRWQSDGGVPWHAADRIATRMGYHPINLWPEWGRGA